MTGIWTHYDVKVQHVSHYAIGSPSNTNKIIRNIQLYALANTKSWSLTKIKQYFKFTTFSFWSFYLMFFVTFYWKAQFIYYCLQPFSKQNRYDIKNYFWQVLYFYLKPGWHDSTLLRYGGSLAGTIQISFASKLVRHCSCQNHMRVNQKVMCFSLVQGTEAKK